MTKNLSAEATLISDTNAPDLLEQPIIVEDYEGSGGISIVGYDGDSVFMPYRMVK